MKVEFLLEVFFQENIGGLERQQPLRPRDFFARNKETEARESQRGANSYPSSDGVIRDFLSCELEF